MTQTDILQQFIDSANAALYLKDDQGRFLMVNNRVAQMFKASKEEIIGKTDYDFVAKEEAEMFRAYDRKVAEAGSPMSFNASISSREGKHTVFDQKFPVSNIEGAPNAVGGIAICGVAKEVILRTAVQRNRGNCLSSLDTNSRIGKM